MLFITGSFTATYPGPRPFPAVDEEAEDAGPQAELPADRDFIIIPFKMAGRLLMVDAVVDGQSGNLIFDTGASGIVVNQTYFRKYTRQTGNRSNGITGGVSNVTDISLGNIRISDLEVKKISATVADLSHIENQKGVKVLGLFGFKMIRDFEIVIDINRQVLQLCKIDDHGNRLNGTLPAFPADHWQNFTSSRNVVFIRGEIAGKELKFCLDTGAEINALSSSCSRSILKTVSITGRSNLSGAGAGQPKVLSGTMTEFSFGGRELTPMFSLITSLDALAQAYETSLDGMLGYDFLKKGAICINFVKKQMGIAYNTKQGA